MAPRKPKTPVVEATPPQPQETAHARVMALLARGEVVAAVDYSETLIGRPEYFETLHLLGVHAQTLGYTAEAQRYYERALAAKPDFAFSKLALAQMKMMRSDFREGRDGYEARFDAVTESTGPDWRGLPIPRWKGESVQGKRIYLWAEQGLGDIAMFATFLPHLLAQGPSRIALGMFPKLIPLFKRSFPQIDVEPIDDAAHHALAPTMLTSFPEIEKFAMHTNVPFSLEPLRRSYDYARIHGLFNYAAPMGDLLVYCLPQYIPATNKHPLIADRKRLKETKTLLTGKPGKKMVKTIGISWHTTNTRETTRNMFLEDLLPLLKLPRYRFISLQHHASRAEIERFNAQHNVAIEVLPQVDLMQDAESLVALIAAMDEVITIDNSNAHLAGALGVKTTLLLPRGSNFRWPVQPDGGTLWYKSVKTMRQTTLNDWKPIIEALAEARR